MDIISISTAVVSFLTSQIVKSKGFKKATDEVSTKIWDWIKSVFTKDNTPLKEFEKNPNDELNKSEINVKIQKYLKNNPNEIETILELLSKSGTNINQINIINSKIDSKGNVTIVGNKIINKS